MSYFSSRWIEAPKNATELPDNPLPQGFRAAGGACGIKPDGTPDLALLVSDAPATVSAARFSRTGAPGAPVVMTRRRSDIRALRAVVVSSGNANAATGEQGLLDAGRMRSAAAAAAGVKPQQVAVAGTGVIGVPLPIDLVEAGIERLGPELSAAGADAFAAAIRTTDALDKQVTLDVELTAGTVRIAVQAKGAGMISPSFATLLVFVQTDAALDADEAKLLLSVCTKRSFDRISVDGQLSTSDTIVLQASGASGITISSETEDERVFGEALDAALRQTALLVVRDGEGARRIARLTVHGHDRAGAVLAARAVADSPLVKTALYGGDPNWGRIIAAVGAALPEAAPVEATIEIEGIKVCEHGSFVPCDAAALAAAVDREEVEYEVWLSGRDQEEGPVERFFSDLGHEYVTINAEYTT